MADRLKIIRGPSKWDLMLALFERKPVVFEVRRHAFVVEIKMEVEALFNEYSWATITLDEFSDDADGNWLIEGIFAGKADYLPDNLKDLLKEVSDVREDNIIRAAYSTVKREGVLRCVAREGLAFEEHLRFELGDRIWGDPSWRDKEL